MDRDELFDQLNKIIKYETDLTEAEKVVAFRRREVDTAVDRYATARMKRDLLADLRNKANIQITRYRRDIGEDEYQRLIGEWDEQTRSNTSNS